MTRDYDFHEVETRWARAWVERRAWAAPELPSRTKRYALTMFPYPSGDMHMGHVEVFAIHDAIARYMRMRGYEEIGRAHV